jgi:hypothetical protein
MSVWGWTGEVVADREMRFVFREPGAADTRQGVRPGCWGALRDQSPVCFAVLCEVCGRREGALEAGRDWLS